MTRANKEQYTQVEIKKTTTENLRKIKIHPNQSYDEVIQNMIDEKLSK